MKGSDFAAQIVNSGAIFGLKAGSTRDDFDRLLSFEHLEESDNERGRGGLTRRDYGLFEATFSRVGDQRCTSIIVEFHRLCSDESLALEYGDLVGIALPKAVRWIDIEKSLANLGAQSYNLISHSGDFAIYGFPWSGVFAHVLHADGEAEGSLPGGSLWSIEILPGETWQATERTLPSMTIS